MSTYSKLKDCLDIFFLFFLYVDRFWFECDLAAIFTSLDDFCHEERWVLTFRKDQLETSQFVSFHCILTCHILQFFFCFYTGVGLPLVIFEFRIPVSLLPVTVCIILFSDRQDFLFWVAIVLIIIVIVDHFLFICLLCVCVSVCARTCY